MSAPLQSAAQLGLNARAARASVVLALALPFLFLHKQYQFDLRPGGGVDVYTSDLALLAVVVAAVIVARREGLGRLRAAAPLWAAAAAFLAWIAVDWLIPAALHGSRYPAGTHLVTALKWGEYALLAPAAALLVRSRDDVLIVLGAATAWSAAATAWAVLQFVGALPANEAYGPGTREPSLLGIHDFGALSGGVFAIALTAIALGARRRRLELAAGIAGGLGVALAAAMDGVLAVVLAAAAIAAIARGRRVLTLRRAAALVGAVAVVALAAVSLRGSAIDAFLRFVGVKPENAQTTGHVQTWSQRVLLGYVGLRVWIHHPLIGAGWGASLDYPVLAPELPAAHRRFPDQPAQAFPSPQVPYGPQSSAVQLLAELGVVGLLLALATMAAGIWTAARAALRGPPAEAGAATVAVGWILVAAAVSLGVGIFAGIPLDALLWLGLGLAAAVAAGTASRPV